MQTMSILVHHLQLHFLNILAFYLTPLNLNVLKGCADPTKSTINEGVSIIENRLVSNRKLWARSK